MTRLFFLALAAFALAAPAALAADGASVFQSRCAACHGKAGEGTAMAPPLKGVFGRKAGQGSYPRYTAALKAAGFAWTADNLDAYLKAPSAKVPGGAMAVPTPDAGERTAVIGYLQTLN